jgi:hypothetical protein
MLLEPAYHVLGRWILCGQLVRIVDISNIEEAELLFPFAYVKDVGSLRYLNLSAIAEDAKAKWGFELFGGIRSRAKCNALPLGKRADLGLLLLIGLASASSAGAHRYNECHDQHHQQREPKGMRSCSPVHAYLSFCSPCHSLLLRPLEGLCARQITKIPPQDGNRPNPRRRGPRTPEAFGFREDLCSTASTLKVGRTGIKGTALNRRV